MPRPTSKNDLLNAAKAKVQKVEGTSTDPYITSVVDKVSIILFTYSNAVGEFEFVVFQLSDYLVLRHRFSKQVGMFFFTEFV